MARGTTASTDTFSVRSPALIEYGLGATESLTAFASDRPIDRALLVTDADVAAAGVIDPVEEALSAADVTSDRYEGVKPEPKLSMVEEAAERLAAHDYDLVIGVGGGSSLDTAKLAAVLAAHDVDVRDMLGMDNVPGPGLPLALVPTTAGTGSEVTHIGVFSDAEDDGNKKVVYSAHLFCDVAIVDPELTRTMPKGVAAATGLDALTHAIESYVSNVRTPYTDVLARRAIELIGENLRQAVHRGRHDDEARYNMSLAAMLAGQAFVNSGLGAVHALTYPLGVRHGIGHGRANAMLLPHVMAYNVPADPTRFADVARLLGYRSDATETVLEQARASVDAVVGLTEDVGIPPRIGGVEGIEPDSFEEFADIAFEYSPHNIERNPRSLDREDVVAIFERAY